MPGSPLKFAFNVKHNLESSGEGETCVLVYIIFAHCVLSSFLKLQVSFEVLFFFFSFSHLANFESHSLGVAAGDRAFEFSLSGNVLIFSLYS